MPIHVVEQGDHLSSIADEAGFRDFRTVWMRPENADLRDLRKNPHVLFPGDNLFVPEKELKTADRPTGALHTFQVKTDKLKLRVLIQNIDGDAIDDTTVSLLVDGVASREKTSNGMLEKQIPRKARDGKIELSDDQIPMGIGQLDPVTEQSGQLARLLNLGYYRRPLDPIDDDEWKSSVEEFQCDQGIDPVTGICDADTQTKLEDAHGC